jgi:hypothetical protein
MCEESRRVQCVINALGQRDVVEACGMVDGLIALAARHSQLRKTVVPKSRNDPQSIDN